MRRKEDAAANRQIWKASCVVQAGAPAARIRTAYRLCELLDCIMDMSALRQNALIALAVAAELVPRLWFSALKVAACLHIS